MPSEAERLRAVRVAFEAKVASARRAEKRCEIAIREAHTAGISHGKIWSEAVEPMADRPMSMATFYRKYSPTSNES